MRKHTSFAIAATMLLLAGMLWAKYSVLASSPESARTNLSNAPAQAPFRRAGRSNPCGDLLRRSRHSERERTMKQLATLAAFAFVVGIGGPAKAECSGPNCAS
jgi:hypothetical protein